jgi:outer membrane protein W
MKLFHKVSIFSILILISITACFAQRDGYFFVGGELGVPFSKYLDQKNTLTNRFYNNHTALNISCQYRLWNRLGLEGGLGQHYEYLAFNDDNFSNRNKGFVADLSSKNAFLNAFGAIQYLHPIKSNFRIYAGAGYSLNWVTGARTASKTSTYIAGQESLTLKNSFFNNTSIYGEIGMEGTLVNDAVLSVGIKYNIGQSSMMSGDYTVAKNASIIEQDNITSMGTYLGITVKYGFNFYHREKVIKPIKEKTTPSTAPEKVKPEKEIKVKPPKDETIPKSVDGRSVSVTKKISVKKNEIIIKVWDHEVVDGDIISLNFNGKWILQNFTLEKGAKEIRVTLQPGTNYLVLHAHNLGQYSPNTAAIIVDDGVKENKVILQSTLNASGTIQIDLK